MLEIEQTKTKLNEIEEAREPEREARVQEQIEALAKDWYIAKHDREEHLKEIAAKAATNVAAKSAIKP